MAKKYRQTKASLLQYYFVEKFTLQTSYKFSKKYIKWYNLKILDEKELNHGQVISKFGQLQFQFEPEIGQKAWIKSGPIEHYDDLRV